jgi:hypothetical protein
VKPEVIEFRPQRPWGRQVHRLVTFLRDQLLPKFFRRQARVHSPRPKLGIGLAESFGNVANVREQVRQVFLDPRSPSRCKRVAAGDAGLQLVHPFTNRGTAPSEFGLGLPLPAISQGLHGPRHEKPPLGSVQRSCRFDDVGFEPIREFHGVAPSTRKKQYTNPGRFLGYLFFSESLS